MATPFAVAPALSSSSSAAAGVVADDRRELITRTAIWMADNPGGAEAVRSAKRGDAKFQFMFESQSTAEGAFFKERLNDRRAEIEVRQVCSQDEDGVATVTAVAAGSATPPSSVAFTEEGTAGVKRGRKRRWGPPSSSSSFSSDEQRQHREQKEMQRLEERVREAEKRSFIGPPSASSSSSDLHEARVAQYEDLAERDSAGPRDTLEDAERGAVRDGSWEHRKRAAEMLLTAETSFKATEAGRGSTHIGHFLPKAELDKFLNSGGRGNGDEAVGMKQLMPDTNSGAVRPSVTASSSSSSAGPTAATGDEDEDEFARYRKRMQLSYRFRPNPLNNPRRAYY